MRFSIIIPVYNTIKYLNECVDSVLKQDYTDYEIILVDDGSTDGSGPLCDKLAEKEPERIIAAHQENKGQFYARYNGVLRSRGEYCLFVDSDDLVRSDALSVLNGKIEEYGSPDLILYPFNYLKNGTLKRSKLISDEERTFYREDLKILYEVYFSGVLLNSMCTKAVKRRIALESVKDLTPFAALRCSEDRLQSLWILDAIDSAVYIPDPIYNYRICDGSTTRTYSYDNISRLNFAILYEEEKEYLKKWGLASPEVIDSFEARQISYALYVLDQFYLNAPKKEKSKILLYPWEEFVSGGVQGENYKSSKRLSDLQKKLWGMVTTGNISGLKRHFRKKKAYLKIRSIKRKITNDN